MFQAGANRPKPGQNLVQTLLDPFLSPAFHKYPSGTTVLVVLKQNPAQHQGTQIQGNHWSTSKWWPAATANGLSRQCPTGHTLSAVHGNAMSDDDSDSDLPVGLNWQFCQQFYKRTDGQKRRQSRCCPGIEPRAINPVDRVCAYTTVLLGQSTNPQHKTIDCTAVGVSHEDHTVQSFLDTFCHNGLQFRIIFA